METPRRLPYDPRPEPARRRAEKGEAKAEVKRRELTVRHEEEQARAQVDEVELKRRRLQSELDLELERRRLEQRLAELKAQVDAVVSKAQAVSPDLVAALQAFSDRALTERVAESMAPLAILGGGSVVEVLGRLLEGTSLARALDGNGSKPAPAKIEG